MSGKRQQTMAKSARERAVRERRERKQEKRRQRKLGLEAEPGEIAADGASTPTTAESSSA